MPRLLPPIELPDPPDLSVPFLGGGGDGNGGSAPGTAERREAVSSDSGGFAPLKGVSTWYTKNVPEAVQVGNPFLWPTTFWARQTDKFPGATLREAKAGPTDQYGDRRGPIDTLWDTLIERGDLREDGAGFEDDSDLPGSSTGDVAADPSGATAQTLGEFFQFGTGRWTITGENGQRPDNPDPGQSAMIGRVLLLLAVLSIVTFAVGQLFDVQVG